MCLLEWIIVLHVPHTRHWVFHSDTLGMTRELVLRRSAFKVERVFVCDAMLSVSLRSLLEDDLLECIDISSIWNIIGRSSFVAGATSGVLNSNAVVCVREVNIDGIIVASVSMEDYWLW
ncbi:hypothetical protein PUNSTDRAFT_49635 [Punctularia strigosozonata HHB-11173 SS5]|uniref:uncharacterized protein n=1 Tax=Punctularia strigosozonata (strain HHB-11173) TaxID=741275 RepID=UPI0004417703|nr:uncharacterized protein PUNSTDRAFT_49635 [Punctularia strigosozonata HHB-11173 SS5]EIN12400.1 hypothetical protein PUNSTDRAFT_49635 [Punctularia strigosozonata HHB-11173 SS5]